MKQLSLALFVLAGVAAPAVAVAQDADTDPQPYRKWDASGMWAVRFGCSYDCDPVIPNGSWSAETGYYWTAHVKTSIGVATTPAETSVGYSSGYTYRCDAARPVALSASVAYQFFENAFVHPFVSAGARIAWVSRTTETYSPVPPYTSTRVTGPTRVQARPVIAGGFKSYFDNGRVFMQSELGLTLGSTRETHPVLRIGAGVDF